MIRLFRYLYLPDRFFVLLGIVVAVFAISFFLDLFFYAGQIALLSLFALTFVDILFLFGKKTIVNAGRKTPKIFSVGDENEIHINIENNYGMPLFINLIDEIPVQFQERNFSMSMFLAPGAVKKLRYSLKPLTRGEYEFQDLNVYVKSLIGLAERRIRVKCGKMVPVYPSVIQMRKFELKTLKKMSQFYGIKKIRRLGGGSEFEEIKNYVTGDDYRKINWKATSRRNSLMVNLYEDEKAQQVYALIDISRSMSLSHEGMSLLDYSINTSLVILNTALQKHDKAGLITFSNEIDRVVPAERSRNQLRTVLEALYKVQESKLEANYEKLYMVLKNVVRFRSLIFLYLNFESIYSLHRVLPILRKINRNHLLVVMFFENTDITEYSKTDSANLEEIYLKTIAVKLVNDKHQIIHELKQYGIQVIMNKPNELAANSINKYLELKSRGLI
ncbi:MAG: cell division protein FtsB [Bacteroidetes bacterium GWF2_38_335]|nr:MAG: cell division protein FtsB [Bacteroidetes bacterium GWF2_38_335]OFY79761.1 MAG: cell division protein FtsB [Bacteroidetes bacterium RIFOXYA12_FULL_38_20]HBS88148.1 DUF58 domain-containing protein [Bacteroidales bacterium]